MLAALLTAAALIQPPAGPVVTYRPCIFDDVKAAYNPDPVNWDDGKPLLARVVKHNADGTVDVLVRDVNGWHARKGVRVFEFGSFDYHFSDGPAVTWLRGKP